MEDQSRKSETAESTSNRTQGTEGIERLHSDEDERQDPAQENANEPESVNEDRSGLYYDARSSFQQITPAYVCLLVAVAAVSSVSYFTRLPPEVTYSFISPYQEESGWASPASSAILYAGMFIAWFLVQTMLMVFLCNYRCCMVIRGLLAFLFLLFCNHAFITQLCDLHNMALDYFTLALFNWNICIVGMVCLSWKGPSVLQTMYFIWASASMACAFFKLSREQILLSTSLWSIICTISLYDIFAVVCPKESLQKVMSPPTMTWTVRMADCDREQNTAATEIQLSQHNSDGSVNNQLGAAAELSVDDVENDNRARELHQANAADERGVKLRWGDFVVYGLLAGKASSNGDWNTTIACFVAILIGLCFTLLLSAIYRRTLPALPISLVLGTAFNFATRKLIKPYTDALASEQIFI